MFNCCFPAWKGGLSRTCMLCFVIINSVLLNLLCVWVQASHLQTHKRFKRMLIYHDPSQERFKRMLIYYDPSQERFKRMLIYYDTDTGKVQKNGYLSWHRHRKGSRECLFIMSQTQERFKRTLIYHDTDTGKVQENAYLCNTMVSCPPDCSDESLARLYGWLTALDDRPRYVHRTYKCSPDLERDDWTFPPLTLRNMPFLNIKFIRKYLIRRLS